MSDSFKIIIEPKKGIKNYWKELWRYRELFLFLAWRDVLVRYKQTFIGIAWSVFRPLITMLVFTFVFSKLAKLPSGSNAPYPLMVFSGLLPWHFFSSAINLSSLSLVKNANMVRKVYFPRIIIPTNTLIVSFIDFLIAFIILIGIMIWYQYLPGLQILTLPLFLIIAFIASLGIGLWFSSLNVIYRDFQILVPFFIQFGLYISPVGFNSSIVPEQWRLIYSINPMVGVIDGFRWAILGGDLKLYMPGFILSIVLSLIIFFTGIIFFRKTEKIFADVV
ncbi:MAG: ABC transporter permease [Spirochaetota bacterium]|nr:ABC transporter permease [Spirochaetota bacterium]